MTFNLCSFFCLVQRAGCAEADAPLASVDDGECIGLVDTMIYDTSKKPGMSGWASE